MEATCYWSTLTLHLRTLQEAAVQQVTKQRDIGFIAVNLFTFTSWADTGFPYGLVKGLAAVGYAPPYGIFPQQPARRIGMSEVLEGWQKHNQRILNQLKPGILQQSMEDAANDFCTPPALCGEQSFWPTSGQEHRLIPRYAEVRQATSH